MALKDGVSRVLNESATKSISFTAFGRCVTPRDYSDILYRVSHDEILPVFNPALPASQSHPGLMIFPYNHVSTIFQAANVVHECTHESDCFRGSGYVIDSDHEIVAYLAEHLYLWNRLGPHPPLNWIGPDAAFRRSLDAAAMLLWSRLQVPRTQLVELSHMVRDLPTYRSLTGAPASR